MSRVGDNVLVIILVRSRLPIFLPSIHYSYFTYRYMFTLVLVTHDFNKYFTTALGVLRLLRLQALVHDYQLELRL